MSTLNNGANIEVIGVGGGGVDAVDHVIQNGLAGVEFIAISTNGQSLVKSEAETKLDIGRETSRGLGASADPTVGRRAAEENGEAISAALGDTDMVFITTGEGDGTGARATPVVAEIARSIGALTVGVATRPFEFEGCRRANDAAADLAELRKAVDTLTAIPNDRLLEVADDNLTVLEAYHLADEVLRNGVKGISDLVATPELVNLDFADVKAIMKDAGTALMGIGGATGDDRAMRAAKAAISSPLLEVSIDGAHGVLLSFQSGKNFSLQEMSQASKFVQEAADPSANIIFGHVIDNSLGDVVRVTVIAAGFDEPEGEQFTSASRPAQAPPTRPRTFEDPVPSHRAGEPAIQPVSTGQHHHIATSSHPVAGPVARTSSVPARSIPPVVGEPTTRSSHDLDILAFLFEDR